MNYDMILIHAPSIYDFRNRDDILFAYLSNSDSVHVSPIFEMPPVGMLAINQYLKSRGFQVEYFNIASYMIRYPDFDVREFFEKVSSEFIGFDLHWLAHAHGSTEMAKLYKEIHPAAKTVFGGLSSTYYHEELVDYPHVDYVVRGYDTFLPLELLLKSKNNNNKLRTIPNLTWKNNNEIHVNPLSHKPSHYNAHIDWIEIFNHQRQNMTAYNIVIPQVNCEYNCKFCGGSRYFYDKYMSTRNVIRKTPEMLQRELQSIVDSQSNDHTITMINFWHEYRSIADLAVDVFRAENINTVHFSLHRLPDIEHFRSQVRSAKAIVELSPDSHDLSIAQAMGRGKYTMEEMEDFFDALLDDVFIFEVYFMIGLPHQSADDVRRDVDYCEHLIKKYRGKKVIPYICPMLPFLDPGCEIFDNASKFGYRILHRTLEDHRKALLNMNWKYRTNYETDVLNRDELVKISYEAIRKLTLIKNNFGILPTGIAHDIVNLIDSTCELFDEIESYEKMPESERKIIIEKNLKQKILMYNQDQLTTVRSQQRPVDFGFAKQQWFDTDEAINQVMCERPTVGLGRIA
ncbi:MAG: cobalamin-dependent protein [bacterium]